MMRSEYARLCASAMALAAAALWATAPARAASDAIVIGVLTDMSSVGADNTGNGSVAAAEMAIADFGTTAAGKPIKLLAADHQNKADIGATIARQWLDVDHVA